MTPLDRATEAVRAEDLVAALRKWKCLDCLGLGHLRPAWARGVIGCNTCNGTGLHPIASAALKAYEGEPTQDA